MNPPLSFTTDPAAALCIGCLTSGRQLNLITDKECKLMFNTFLDNVELSEYPISLCYECVARLTSVIFFKKQVRKAQECLLSYTKYSKQPLSMSKLKLGKVDTFDLEPNPTDFITHTLPGDTLREDTLRHDSLQGDIFVKQGRKSKRKHSSDTHNTNTDSNNDTEFADAFNSNHKHKIKRKKSLKFKNDCKTQPIKEVNCGVKIENAMEIIGNQLKFIKVEPADDSTFKVYSDADIEPKTEKSEDKFSDSDDEPLNSIRTRTGKIKKEVKKRERPAGVVSGVWVQRKLQKLNVPAGQLEMVILSWEEVEFERQKSLTHISFTRHEFRCTSCIVGFNHRFKLDSHMKKHLPEAGDLECSICQTRFKTQSALLCHRRRHRSRWRCSQCLALFSRAAIAADHHARAHGAPPPSHACHVCGHCEPSLGKLRIHLKNHSERQHCEQCGKSFRDKSSLKTHLYIHTNQKDFSCGVCDKRFRFKKALEIHRVTHQAPELLYCRDCDMNFKNRLSFYQHVNYSMKHIHPDKIKYACEFCSRRFSKPARLEEHRLSIHLKLAPHRCAVDGCAFASASRPALRTHVRMVHRNKRLERNHVCHTCGKAYTTKKILEGHIRSHTGERPFVCARCPATFSHDAALYNHNKLVHKTPFVRRRKPNQPEAEVPPTWAGPPDAPISGLPDSERSHTPNT